jgi:hypothetical protein
MQSKKSLIKTSYSLPLSLLNALDNDPVAVLSIHRFTIKALDAYLASGSKPMPMRKLCRAMGTTVERDCPKTFRPPASLGKSVDHYKAKAFALKVSLSALIANAVAASLKIHPESS